MLPEIGLYTPCMTGSAAIVIVDSYGKARVISGEIDLGQGATTIFAQIAAEELGLTPSTSFPNIC